MQLLRWYLFFTYLAAFLPEAAGKDASIGRLERRRHAELSVRKGGEVGGVELEEGWGWAVEGKGGGSERDAAKGHPVKKAEGGETKKAGKKGGKKAGKDATGKKGKKVKRTSSGKRSSSAKADKKKLEQGSVRLSGEKKAKMEADSPKKKKAGGTTKGKKAKKAKRHFEEPDEEGQDEAYHYTNEAKKPIGKKSTKRGEPKVKPKKQTKKAPKRRLEEDDEEDEDAELHRAPKKMKKAEKAPKKSSKKHASKESKTSRWRSKAGKRKSPPSGQGKEHALDREEAKRVQRDSDAQTPLADPPVSVLHSTSSSKQGTSSSPANDSAARPPEDPPSIKDHRVVSSSPLKPNSAPDEPPTPQTPDPIPKPKSDPPISCEEDGCPSLTPCGTYVGSSRWGDALECYYQPTGVPARGLQALPTCHYDTHLGRLYGEDNCAACTMRVCAPRHDHLRWMWHPQEPSRTEEKPASAVDDIEDAWQPW